MLKVGNRVTSIDATSFLYKLQQSKEKLPDLDYKQMLDELSSTPQLVANSATKRINKHIRMTKVITGKPKTSKRNPKRSRIEDQLHFGDVTTVEEEMLIIPRQLRQKLQHFYINGAAAFGSVTNQRMAKKVWRKKVVRFLQAEDARTKNLQHRRQFLRLKVIAYDVMKFGQLIKRMSTNWLNLSLESTCSRNSKCSIVLPMQTKSSQKTAETCGRLIKKVVG